MPDTLLNDDLKRCTNEQFKMKDKGTSELKKIEETKAPGTLFTAAPATTANEAFRRVNEDPLLRMRYVRACVSMFSIVIYPGEDYFGSSWVMLRSHHSSSEGMRDVRAEYVTYSHYGGWLKSGSRRRTQGLIDSRW